LLLYLDSYVTHDERDLEKLRQDASNHIDKVHKQNKTYYDSKHKLPTNYIEVYLILINNYDVTPGINNKLIPKFKGPYVIKKKLPNDRFVVTDIPGFKQNQRLYEDIISIGNIRMWQPHIV
jgi:hypothetical protein